MEGFPLELARSIINLELQKENIIERDAKPKRLCYCRKQIFLNFTHICQLMMIRLTSKLIRLVDDIHPTKSSITDIWEWYENEVYTKMYDNPEISNKMILIFKILQDSSDSLFFETFESKFKHTIETSKSPDEFRENVHGLYELLNEWMENYMMTIMTLKIDCMKLSKDLLSEYGMEENFECKGDGLDSNGCKRCDTVTCPALGLGHDEYYAEEEVHIYMCDDFDDGKFLTKYFDIICKYHSFPKNIRIIFDFVWYNRADKTLFSETQRQLVQYAAEKFKAVDIINHKNILLNNCRAEIVKYLR
jgi:hypothetical protein